MADRGEFEAFLEWGGAPSGSLVVYDITEEEGHLRSAVSVATTTSEIPAFLFVPTGDAVGAVVVVHQHAGQRHLGKSEVAGLAGDPLLAWGPMLAIRGFIVLAPDMIGFEDRRSSGPGTDERPDDADRQYHEMSSRLARGRMLMSDVVEDVAASVTALSTYAPGLRIGVAGHSFGGTTALFTAALDDRVAWMVSSGAAGTIASRIESGAGLEFSLVMPGFMRRWDIGDVLELVAPRPALVMSAEDDPYSMDTGRVVDQARPAWGDSSGDLAHLCYEGGHALTADRVDDAIRWISERSVV